MSRYYALVVRPETYGIVHLSLAPVLTGVWPHTLCGERTEPGGDVDRVATCVICIAQSVRYDEQLAEDVDDVVYVVPPWLTA